MKFKRSVPILAGIAAIFIICICLIGYLCGAFTDDNINELPVVTPIGEFRDYEQTVIVEINYWDIGGCEGVVVDSCNHDMLKKGDTVFVNIYRDDSKVYNKDEIEIQYDRRSNDANPCGIAAGSMIEVKFKGLAYKNIDRPIIFVEELKEIEE